jgi:hypothetical protein
MKVARSTAYVRRFAAYVKDGADDPEQALMEVSNSASTWKSPTSRSGQT